ncbi:DUF6524 family protein [Thalassotalea ponticola]|uniref:DUF6524 family protein n=1 Tax=Thalassotalea ponticola TaxID=1523392 RepID=UPI0025B46482|nr:DUF6524 family protein [Thalassotalea ponticola]MDN3651278.1 DUF6524 family protein [Thalassotalea ponticola]
MKEISPQGFSIRFIFALLLVLLTYNPTQYCFIRWVQSAGFSPQVLLAGVVLLTGWIIYVNATLRSMGVLGLALASAFFAALVWLLVEWGVLSLEETTGITWIVLVILAAILALGMSWSHIRRRMSGQMDTDEI